jgi:hypothetical protein
MSLGRFAGILALTIGIGMGTGDANNSLGSAAGNSTDTGGTLGSPVAPAASAYPDLSGNPEPFSILGTSPYLVGEAAN